MTETYDRRHFRRALQALREHGILLRIDRSFPNIATLVAGEPIVGSWWAHPANHDIYHVSVDLAEHDDVMLAKLVSAKDTYVHRDLWPGLLAAGAGRDRWQLDGLSSMARRLLAAVTRNGELRTDEIPRTGSRKDSPGEATRQLERRLLVAAEEVHTVSGAHAKRLMSWARWAKRAGLTSRRRSSERGRRELEEVVASLNERFDANGRLPWPKREATT